MRAKLRSYVAKAAGDGGGYVEVHDIVVETEFDDEQDALEMFKARATAHPTMSVPDERGRAVIRLVKKL